MSPVIYEALYTTGSRGSDEALRECIKRTEKDGSKVRGVVVGLIRKGLCGPVIDVTMTIEMPDLPICRKVELEVAVLGNKPQETTHDPR